VAADVLSMVTVGDFVTNNSRMDRPRIFKLGGVVPCDLLCVTTVQSQKVKVVNYRKPPNGKTNSKNAITQQRMIISASNLVKMVTVGDKMSEILSRSVRQIHRTYVLHNEKINQKMY